MFTRPGSAQKFYDKSSLDVDTNPTVHRGPV